MRKFYAYLSFMFLIPIVSAAQDVIDIGQDIGKSASEVKAEKENDENLFDMLGMDKNSAETQEDVKENAKAENKPKNKGFLSRLSEMIFGKSDNDDKSTEEMEKNKDETQKNFLERLENNAEAGDLKAQKALAYMYFSGEKDVPVDYQKSFKYYEMAAKQNDPVAMTNLGSFYYNGIGIPANRQVAIELFEKAADAGNSEAALTLGFLYLSNRNAADNASHSLELFKKSADAGSIVAKYMLGYAYYRGFGVQQDYNLAAKMIKEAADVDFDEAQYIMGYIYLNGQGIAKNYSNAKKYMTYAANQGNLSAMMELAKLYSDGSALKSDPISAYVIYNIASVMGEESAASLRDQIEKKLKIEEIAEAQNIAENFKVKPSEITLYVQKTFGENIRRYIDDNMKKK